MPSLGHAVPSCPSGAGSAASGPLVSLQNSAVDGSAAPALWGYPGYKLEGVGGALRREAGGAKGVESSHTMKAGEGVQGLAARA